MGAFLMLMLAPAFAAIWLLLALRDVAVWVYELLTGRDLFGLDDESADDNGTRAEWDAYWRAVEEDDRS